MTSNIVVYVARPYSGKLGSDMTPLIVALSAIFFSLDHSNHYTTRCS